MNLKSARECEFERVCPSAFSSFYTKTQLGIFCRRQKALVDSKSQGDDLMLASKSTFESFCSRIALRLDAWKG